MTSGRRPRVDYAAAAALLDGGMPVREVAARYGVSVSAIHKARRAGHLPKLGPVRRRSVPAQGYSGTITTEPPTVSVVVEDASPGLALLRALTTFIEELDARVVRAIEG